MIFIAGGDSCSFLDKAWFESQHIAVGSWTYLVVADSYRDECPQLLHPSSNGMRQFYLQMEPNFINDS